MSKILTGRFEETHLTTISKRNQNILAHVECSSIQP